MASHCWRKLVLVGDQVAVDDRCEDDLMALEHSELRDSLVANYDSLADTQRARIDADTTYGWVEETSGTVSVRLAAGDRNKQETVRPALAAWAVAQNATLCFVGQ